MPVSRKVNVLRIVIVPTNIGSAFLSNVNIRLPPTTDIHHGHFAHFLHSKPCMPVTRSRAQTYKTCQYLQKRRVCTFVTFYLLFDIKFTKLNIFFSHNIVDLVKVWVFSLSIYIRSIDFASASNINPLSNLKKNDLIDELDSRDIDVYNLNKTDLQSKLSEILHGIQRPAALIC